MAGTKSAELQAAIERANDALELKAQAVEQLGDARELARLLVKNGVGSDEQIEWVETNLPVRQYTPKNGDEDDAGE